MSEQKTILNQTIAGRDIHRRSFTKADGRELFLYGYKAHDLPVMSEDSSDVAKGGELRFHPLRTEWNLYAPHRQNRTFKPSAADDPLSPTQSGGTATEIPFSDFELAIFENKFTSLHAQAPAPTDLGALADTARAKGRCDVVVYSPEASGNLSTIGHDKRRLLIAAWNDRYSTLLDAGYDFVMPFENRGDAVGVTLHHPHGQIYAFPFIPAVQKNAAKAFDKGYNLAGLIKDAWTDYGITEAGGMRAFCPPFARFPYEVWIAPRSKKPGPWAFDAEELDGFAHLLGDITRRYDSFFGCETPYMLSLHAAPLGFAKTFHFTAQFYPLLRAPNRIKYLASVEQATGVFTVDVMPEHAAKTLKSL